MDGGVHETSADHGPLLRAVTLVGAGVVVDRAVAARGSDTLDAIMASATKAALKIRRAATAMTSE